MLDLSMAFLYYLMLTTYGSSALMNINNIQKKFTLTFLETLPKAHTVWVIVCPSFLSKVESMLIVYDSKWNRINYHFCNRYVRVIWMQMIEKYWFRLICFLETCSSILFDYLIIISHHRHHHHHNVLSMIKSRW